jgi:hypothetical protein
MKLPAAALMVCTAGMCAAPHAIAQTQHQVTQLTRYRLTFTISDPQQHNAPQSFVLDVPVSPDHPGTSSLSVSTGLTGQEEGSVEQTLQCTDVHASATGLAAKVAFTMHTVLHPLPNSNEPLHRQMNFDRSVDLSLGKPTRLTGDGHVKPLKPSDLSSPAPPQITVMVTKL